VARGGVPGRVRVEGVCDQCAGVDSDVVDVHVPDAPAVRRERVAHEVRREVADPFEVGENLERRRDEPEVARDRLLEREQVDAVRLEVEVKSVDRVVAVDDLLCDGFVVVFERVQPAVEAFQDEVAQLLDVCAEFVEGGLVLVSWHTVTRTCR